MVVSCHGGVPTATSTVVSTATSTAVSTPVGDGE